MEASNVNNLNGVPNFGHGIIENQNETADEGAKGDEGVQDGEASLGVEDGVESKKPKASRRNSSK